MSIPIPGPAPTRFVSVEDAATTTVTDIITVQHLSTGTPSTGFGAGLLFKLEDASGNEDDAGRIATIWQNAGSGTESSQIVFQTRDAGAALATVMTIDDEVAADYYFATDIYGGGLAMTTNGTLSLYGGGGADGNNLYLTNLSNITATAAGVRPGVTVESSWQVAGSSASTYRAFEVSSAINVTGGGAGSYTLIQGIAAESTLPTGPNYLINLGVGTYTAPVSRFNVTNTGLVSVLALDSATNSVTDVLTVQHLTSGTAAAGFGSGIYFKLEDASGNTDDSGRIVNSWIDATGGSEDSQFLFQLRTAGGALATVFSILSTGFQGSFLPRVNQQSNPSSITPNMTSEDAYDITALNQTLTINAPTGNGIVNMRRLNFRIKSTGAETLTWNSGAGGYIAQGATMPTTTTDGKVHNVMFMYDDTLGKFACVSAIVEA